MALLDRVTTLIKANLNDLVEKAENPEKLLKQLLLDMQNQYMQAKTQVAIAIADQHLLEKKQRENLDAQKDLLRKAELAVRSGDEGLARAALDRSLTYEDAAKNFTQQIEDQSYQVQMLRDALHRLEQKMTETKAKAEILVAQHRRARLASRTGAGPVEGWQTEAAFDRVRNKIDEAEVLSRAGLSLDRPDTEQRLAMLERSDQVERILADLKVKALGNGQ